MSRFSRSRRKASYSGRKSARRPTRRYSATSGKFKRTGKGRYKRKATGTFNRSSRSGGATSNASGAGLKVSTGLIALVIGGGALYWMSQKRAASMAAAQAASIAAAAAKTASGGSPFPTAAAGTAPAPTPAPAANFLAPDHETCSSRSPRCSGAGAGPDLRPGIASWGSPATCQAPRCVLRT